MSLNAKAPLCWVTIKTQMHVRTESAHMLIRSRSVSRPHYARVGSLEWIAVDSDRMIRGSVEDRGFEDNKLSPPERRAAHESGCFVSARYLSRLPGAGWLAGWPMHVRARAIYGNRRLALMMVSKKKNGGPLNRT